MLALLDSRSSKSLRRTTDASPKESADPELRPCSSKRRSAYGSLAGNRVQPGSRRILDQFGTEQARLRKEAVTARALLQEVQRNSVMFEEAYNMASAEQESLIVHRLQLVCQLEEIEELQSQLRESDRQGGRQVGLRLQEGGRSSQGLFKILESLGSMFVLEIHPEGKGRLKVLQFICQQQLVKQFHQYVLAQPKVSSNKKFMAFVADQVATMQTVQGEVKEEQEERERKARLQGMSACLREGLGVNGQQLQQAGQQRRRVQAVRGGLARQAQELLVRLEEVQLQLGLYR